MCVFYIHDYDDVTNHTADDDNHDDTDDDTHDDDTHDDAVMLMMILMMMGAETCILLRLKDQRPRPGTNEHPRRAV